MTPMFPRALRIASLAIVLSSAGIRPGRADVVVDFDDLTLAPQSSEYGQNSGGPIVSGPYGPQRDGSFASHGAVFGNRYDLTYGNWSGFAYSNTSDTTTPGYLNEFSAYAGTGHGPGADNYGVAFGYADVEPNFLDPNPFDPTDPAQLMELPTNSLPSGTAIEGMYVTNTTYAALSMLRGDSFARKFGGATGDDPDYFKLTAYGTDALGHALANSVDFYLADYRFADNTLDYIVKDWAFLDLSSLSGAAQLHFNLSSSDVGLFGMNTPAYFAVDDIQLRTNAVAVPEPASLALTAAGLLGLASFHRKARRGTASLAIVLVALGFAAPARADFDPQAGLPGSLAIPGTSDLFVDWASSVVSFDPGLQDITNPSGPRVSYGSPSNALGSVIGNTNGLVSLGDAGSITLGFDGGIGNGAGADFAVFENGFRFGGPGLAFLELAFVDVSSDGVNFFRFPSISLTQTETQVGGFSPLDARNLHNLAGKYVAGFGTGFDLADLAGMSPLLDINHVIQVRITDVVGSIDPNFGSRDSQGHLINDPFKTPSGSSGFDLDGVGVIHLASVPEPSSWWLGLVGTGLIPLASRLTRKRASS
ncbi:DUF4465 domain-containing protein [Tundrisphaera lichenicola]|uniref:DUF4465 domain-containing protein n=1 Tax=Tundrisphaera lichenicola TaxID=2029860 RepID=UPI003EBF841E